MNYFDLKELYKRIQEQKLKVALAEEKGMSITNSLNDMPTSGGTSNKVADAVECAYLERQKQKKLEDELDGYIAAIPNSYVKQIIISKVKGNLSWNKIAMQLGGNNTGDGVRMMCTRYKW